MEATPPEDRADPRRPTSPSVRRRLLLLTLSVLLPTSGISLIAAHTIYTEARQSVTTTATYTARALSLVADRELAYRAGILRTLASSPTLDRGDLQGFYDQAKAVAPTYANAVILSDTNGQQLLNTRVPLQSSTPLPRVRIPDQEAGRLEGHPVISDLYMAPIGKQHSFAVRVPVVREGQVRWYVSMGSFASQMQRIFEQQDLPAGWTGTLLDSKGRVVARNLSPEKTVGRSATPDMLDQLAAQNHGTHETVTLDGIPVVTVFNRAPDSGWTVLIGLPRAELSRPALRALGTMLSISLLLSAVAIVAAMRLGRGIAGPVARLQADAEALGNGQRVAETPTGLAETDVVQRLLAKASRDLHEADAKLHSQVREAVAEAERAQRTALGVQKLEALGRLTGGIAHDFNNLLQTLSSGVQLAARLCDDARAQKALATCERAVGKAVKLTRQLMSFGRAQPGHLEVIDLQEQFDGMGDLLRGALRESVALHLSVEAGIWPVKVDPVQLELAVLNLCLNARDAIDGPGEVRVSAGRRSLASGEVEGLDGGDFVTLTIADSGHGIPADMLPRVFEPFFTTKPTGKGTGLGLAQVYAFALQSRGATQVRSTPGEGTTVTLFLPRSGEPVSRPAPARVPAPHPVRFAGTVLLVEDDPLVRGLTSETLENAGYTVLVASSADDALAICAARDDIDVVLSDVVMPGDKNGVDLVRLLRELRPALRAMLATGYAEAPTTPFPVRVIAKPYDMEQLAQWLADEIAASRAAAAR